MIKIKSFFPDKKAVKSSDENMVILKEEYDNWRGDISTKIDDVLVIGFQI